jgi:hypothetical protein
MHPTVTFVAVLAKETRFICRHAAVDNEFVNLFQRLQVQAANNANPANPPANNP